MATWVIALHLLLLYHVALTVAEPLADIDTSQCGQTKGCFRSPGACRSHQCKFILTWRESAQKDRVHFELNVLTSDDVPWVGVGFSNDTEMADTSVVDCIVNGSTSSQIIVQMSYNPGHYNKVLSPNSKLGLVDNDTQTSYDNGRLACTFTRLVTVASAEVADLTLSHYIFIASGPTDGNGRKHRHSSLPVISQQKIKMWENSDIRAGGFIIYHASLMIVAWMFLSSIGVVSSRHYKNTWSTRICDQKLWFQIHRLAMALTFLLSVAAAVIIFIDLSVIPLKNLKLHPILGMIVLCLMATNILLGLIRPSVGSSKRPIFNWSHCLVGNGAHLIAVVAMYFGAVALSYRVPVRDWLRWVIVGYGAWRLLIDVILTIERFVNKEDLRVAYVEMSGSGDQIILDNKALTFKRVILLVYLLGLLGFTIATLYGTISAF